MATLSSHKGAKDRKSIETAAPHLLFAPPCSPDLNPNELALSKLQALCARQLNVPWTAYGRQLHASPTPSRPKNAETTSPPPDTIQDDRTPL